MFTIILVLSIAIVTLIISVFMFLSGYKEEAEMLKFSAYGLIFFFAFILAMCFCFK